LSARKSGEGKSAECHSLHSQPVEDAAAATGLSARGLRWAREARG